MPVTKRVLCDSKKVVSTINCGGLRPQYPIFVSGDGVTVHCGRDNKIEICDQNVAYLRAEATAVAFGSRAKSVMRHKSRLPPGYMVTTSI